LLCAHRVAAKFEGTAKIVQDRKLNVAGRALEVHLTGKRRRGLDEQRPETDKAQQKRESRNAQESREHVMNSTSEYETATATAPPGELIESDALIRVNAHFFGFATHLHRKNSADGPGRRI